MPAGGFCLHGGPRRRQPAAEKSPHHATAAAAMPPAQREECGRERGAGKQHTEEALGWLAGLTTRKDRVGVSMAAPQNAIGRLLLRVSRSFLRFFVVFLVLMCTCLFLSHGHVRFFLLRGLLRFFHYLTSLIALQLCVLQWGRAVLLVFLSPLSWRSIQCCYSQRVLAATSECGNVLLACPVTGVQNKLFP